MRMSRRSAGAMLLSAAALGGCASAANVVEAKYPPLGRFVDVRGARLHLHRQGPADAQKVVLIHGASGNLRDFTFNFAPSLAKRYDVICIDRPGFGHSTRGPLNTAHRPDVQAEMMRAALGAIGVERAIIVGHSWGAAPALAWALDAPQSVEGVVSLAGVSHPWDGGVGLFSTMASNNYLGPLVVGAFRNFISENGAAEELPRIFAPQTPPEGYADYVGVGLALRTKTMRSNAKDLAHLHALLAQQEARYPSLRTPIEIVHGEADKIVGITYHAEKLTGAAPQSRLTRLQDVGHMPHHAAPEACINAIDSIAQRANQ